MPDARWDEISPPLSAARPLPAASSDGGRDGGLGAVVAAARVYPEPFPWKRRRVHPKM
jgi:hypothetical protein